MCTGPVGRPIPVPDPQIGYSLHGLGRVGSGMSTVTTGTCIAVFIRTDLKFEGYTATIIHDDQILNLKSR